MPDHRTFTVAICLVSAVVAGMGAGLCRADEDGAGARPAPWPRTVLITNDDGVNDPALAALARAFAESCETYVVAPLEDRSGSADYVSLWSKHVARVEERALGPGIQACGVDGYPGDCVLLALHGLLRDAPPDLVVSGINGGPNLGDDWLASGTIGAARLAAASGVPAIAVSGLDESIPGAMEAVSRWMVDFARSPLVRSLEAGQYLTVSFPRVEPAAIRGVKVARRAGALADVGFDRVYEEPGTTQAGLWALQQPRPVPPASADCDAALHAQGYIVVVPMRADEHDTALLTGLLANPAALPQWRAEVVAD